MDEHRERRPSEASDGGQDVAGDGDAEPPRAIDDSPGTSLKKSGRGMSMRRRIGLKIEPDEREAQGRAAGSTGTNDAGHPDGQPCEGEEWWKVEYKAPPPGHLGAHALPVPSGSGGTSGDLRRGREDGHKSPRPHRHSSIERKLERMEVTATSSPQPSQVHAHETPERANSRRLRVGNELYDASTSHSSPNQKRKIIDLQDTSMSVAKELKRFHEKNDEYPHQQQQQQHQTDGAREDDTGKDAGSSAITPSNLVRPMTKIDIQAGSSTSTSSTRPSSGLVPHVHNPKASESA